MPLVKAIIFAVVAYFIWRAFADAQKKFDAEGFTFIGVSPTWLTASAGLFLLAQIPMAWFWHAAMRHLGQRPRFWDSLCAYFIGGLGKYVPGKAMVVVMRAGLVRSPNADPTVAALCVFIETLTMMAVGGFVGAVYLIWQDAPAGRFSFMLLVAVGLMLATGVPTLPPIFRRVVKLLRVSKAKADIDQLLGRLDFKLMAYGWLANLIAWPIMGLSLWATLQAIPGTREAAGSPIEHLPLLTAATSLAMVAGFLSLLPGGVGVRELVLDVLMKPQFGSLAIIAVVLLRLVWLVTELLISGILYGAVRLIRAWQIRP